MVKQLIISPAEVRRQETIELGTIPVNQYRRSLADELAAGKRPSGMKGEEAAVHDFCRELHEKKSVSDSAYAAVVEHFGERGAVDLIGVIGYYTLVSMVLNVERHPLPDGVPAPLRPLA